MSNDIDAIENRIETKRSMLERSLTQLSRAINPERVTQSVADEVQARGGELGRQAVDTVRANPAGALLVGAGLLALLAGPKRPANPPARTTKAAAPGLAESDPLTGEFDRRVAAAEAQQHAEPKAPKLRAALHSGLANLPEPARKKVIAAREAAIDVQDKLDRKAAEARRRANSYHVRQPLSTGAIALGIGALVGAALPRTKIEDDRLGAQRDQLLQRAELALRDEIAAAAQTGESALRQGLRATKEEWSKS